MNNQKNLPQKKRVEELSTSEEIDELRDEYTNTINDDKVKYFPDVAVQALNLNTDPQICNFPKITGEN